MDNTAIDFLKKLGCENRLFVDVGANDGITGSMTYNLEQNGWSGILIEPNPILIEELKNKRTSIIINCVI